MSINIFLVLYNWMASLGAQTVKKKKKKNLHAMWKTWVWAGFDSGLRRSPGEGNEKLQYSCLEDPMDRGVWWATVHGGSKRVRHDWATNTHVQPKHPYESKLKSWGWFKVTVSPTGQIWVHQESLTGLNARLYTNLGLEIDKIPFAYVVCMFYTFSSCIRHG